MAIGVEMETAARLLGGTDPNSLMSTITLPSMEAGTQSMTTQKMTRDAPPTVPALSYTQTQALDAPSRALMRDIRRTAVGGWLLAGVLLENALSANDLNKNPTNSKSVTKSSWFSSAVTSTASIKGANNGGRGEGGEDGKEKEERDASKAGLQRLVLECYSRAVAWTGEDTPEVERAALMARLTKAQTAFAQVSCMA